MVIKLDVRKIVAWLTTNADEWSGCVWHVSDSVGGSRGKSLHHDARAGVGALTNNGHLRDLSVLTAQGNNQKQKVGFTCIVW